LARNGFVRTSWISPKLEKSSRAKTPSRKEIRSGLAYSLRETHLWLRLRRAVLFRVNPWLKTGFFSACQGAAAVIARAFGVFGEVRYSNGSARPSVYRSVKRAALALTVCLPLLYSFAADYLSAEHKFRLIESERLRPGTRVTLTSAELNAYVHQAIAEEFPSGVRDARLTLTGGRATGFANIDFGKVRRAQGKPPGWLMSKLIDGERPVEVAANIRSARGQCTVDVESVKVSGITIDGKVLDFLIQYYLLPNYPEAKVGEPFALHYRIDRLEVKPGAVDVVIQ
jgi:hypothetical protein